MASPYALDLADILISTADITAIQTALNSLDTTPVGVDRPNIFLRPPDIRALNSALRAGAAAPLESANLKLATNEVSYIRTHSLFTANTNV